MRIVVVTGMSGSGKTSALRALEDLGFYAIDNLPISLLDKLVELFSSAKGEVERLALVVDVRSSQGAPEPEAVLAAIPDALEATRRAGHEVDVVFLEASDDMLARRFSETRRKHPLSADGNVKAGIAEERRLLEPLKQAATTELDSSQMSVHELKAAIQHAFGVGHGAKAEPSVTVMSFGFKHGVPTHADLVLDVRFLPNPYFVEELKNLTGNDASVDGYVMGFEDSAAFLEKVKDLLSFLMPRYGDEGKVYLTLAFGCTGGRHRSVTLANRVGEWLRQRGTRVQVRHRDIDR